MPVWDVDQVSALPAIRLAALAVVDLAVLGLLLLADDLLGLQVLGAVVLNCHWKIPFIHDDSSWDDLHFVWKAAPFDYSARICI